MGEKSEQKREYIITKEKEVFVRKGFRKVTMKDIVEACEISRGGLYLYFGSTKEIFFAILSRQWEEEEEEFERNVGEISTMSDILILFLKEQKKQILRKKDDITIATYEYLFSCKEEESEENIFLNQFKKGRMVLAKILEEGIASGEFYCEDPNRTATNIMYLLEGMKICSRTMGLSENKVDRELLYVISGLLMEE